MIATTDHQNILIGKRKTDDRVNREQSKRFDWSLNNTITWEHIFAEKCINTILTLVQEAEERQSWADRIEAA